MGVALKQTAVLTLVNEETCLLSLEPVNVKAQPVLHGNIGMALAQQEAVTAIDGSLDGQCGLALIVDRVQALAHHQLQGNGYLLTADVHAHAVCLHDSSLAIHIYHQSGQQVALAMHQSVGIARLTVGQSDGLAHPKSLAQAFLPEGIVDRFLLKGEHPHGNASHLPVSLAEEIMLAVKHSHHIAFLGVALQIHHRAREYPGVKSLEALFLASSQYYVLTHPSFLFYVFLWSCAASARPRSPPGLCPWPSWCAQDCPCLQPCGCAWAWPSAQHR